MLDNFLKLCSRGRKEGGAAREGGARGGLKVKVVLLQSKFQKRERKGETSTKKG